MLTILNMLLKNLKGYHIILASKSPRRQELLKELDISFTIETKEIEEVYPLELTDFKISDYLSKLKATPFKNDLLANDLLITSDTIVWVNNKALGKPKDYNEAFTMLTQLSNNTHKVITSITITNLKFQKNSLRVVNYI